jgi:hypothetical protein
MSIIAGIIGSTVSTSAPPAPPEPNTSLEVRQWIGTYDVGASNGDFYVRLAEYPTAGNIPIGATGSVSNDGTPTPVTVTSNVLTTAYGESVRIISFDVPTPVIRGGTYATFYWYVAP